MHTADYLRIDERLCFVERWPGPGQPVFCIHTAGQSGAQYRAAAPALADRGYHVVVVDLPGHGRSEPAVDGPVHDLSWYADWCVGVVRILSLDQPWLLGCSIGGSIALDMAVTLGQAVRGVVALDPSGVLGSDLPLPRKPLLEDAASPSMRDRTYFGTIEACGRTVPAERAELIAQMHCREDWHVTTSDVHGALAHDIRDRLGRIVCPVYLLSGEDDYFVPPQRVRSIADHIPHALFEVLPGIGHYPMEELVDFADRFERWVRSLREVRG